MRMVLGVLAGLVVCILAVAGIEVLGHAVFPPPPGLDIANPAHADRIMAAMPPAALGFVALAWFTGGLLGAWTAIRISRNPAAGWIIVLILIGFGVYTLVTIPHPTWMWGVCVVLPLLAGWLAQRLGGRSAADTDAAL